MMRVCCVPWSRDGHGAVVGDGVRLCRVSPPSLSVRWLRFARPWPGINVSLLIHRGHYALALVLTSKVFSFDCLILSERDLQTLPSVYVYCFMKQAGMMTSV